LEVLLRDMPMLDKTFKLSISSDLVVINDIFRAFVIDFLDCFGRATGVPR